MSGVVTGRSAVALPWLCPAADALLRDSKAKHADLQDLLLTLARDVNDRDGERKTQLAELTARLREFETVTAKQFQESERTNTALYNVVFAAKPKGDQP